MIDAETVKRLQECVRRERRSLLQYAVSVPLWTTPDDQPAVERLRAIAEREAAAIDNLARRLEESRAGRVHLGPFPSPFTSYNDVAFRSLLPVIAEAHRRDLVALESDCGAVNSESRPLIEPILATKREHAAELERLAAGA